MSPALPVYHSPLLHQCPLGRALGSHRKTKVQLESFHVRFCALEPRGLTGTLGLGSTYISHTCCMWPCLSLETMPVIFQTNGCMTSKTRHRLLLPLKSFCLSLGDFLKAKWRSATEPQ